MANPSEFNRKLMEEFRANGGKVTGAFADRPLLLLTTIGARSGERQTTPLVYTRDGDRYVIIASMGGAPKHPAWYHNVVANPAVTLELGTETFEARASIVEGAERERLYAAQAAMMPAFNDYAAKTTRVIPVVVLDRVGQEA